MLCFTAITNTSTITQTITGPLVKNTTFATNLFGSFVRTAIWSVGPLENFEFTNITRMNARVNKVALNLIHLGEKVNQKVVTEKDFPALEGCVAQCRRSTTEYKRQ